MRSHARAIAATSAVLLSTLVLGVTTAIAAAPTVAVENASEVSHTTAKAVGTVDRQSQSTTYRFQYVSQASFEAEGWENPVTGVEATLEDGGPGAQGLEGTIEGLVPGRTYHLRLFAENADGSNSAVAASTFTTLDAALPTPATLPATDVSYVTATLHGSVDPNGGPIPIGWYFEVSSDGGANWSYLGGGEISGAEAEGSDPIPVSLNAEGLQDGTDYEVRLSANNAKGTVSADPPHPSFQTLAVTAPTIALGPVEAGTESATVSGTVNPNGFQSAYFIEYTLDGGSSWQAQPVTEDFWAEPLPVDLGDGTDPVPFSQEIKGLEPNRPYEYKVIVRNLGGDTVEGPIQFTSDAAGVGVGNARANSLTHDSARISGFVNPRNSPATYYFEWGTEPDLSDAQSVPTTEDASAGEGNAWVAAGRSLHGLEPASTYYFRLVASNGIGASVASEIASFETYPTPEPEPPYAGPEIPGRGFLPDNRAWELVNAADLGGTGINTGRFALTTEDRVMYVTRGPAPGAEGGYFGSTYIADRTPAGWEARSISLPRSQYRYSKQEGVEGASPDFSEVVAGPTYAQELSSDLLRYRTTPIGEVDLLIPDHSRSNAIEAGIYSSEDLAQVFVYSRYAWDLGIPAGQIAEVGSGSPRLVSVLPGGETGVCVGKFAQEWGASNRTSTDGQRFFFEAMKPGEECGFESPSKKGLYVRIAGPNGDFSSPLARTVRVDEADPDGDNSADASFVQATADGSVVFFETASNLSGDPAEKGGGLYRYDVDTEQRTCITCEFGVRANQLLQNSQTGILKRTLVAETGERVYFRSHSVLSPGGTAGDENLYMIDEEGLRFVATLELGTPLNPGAMTLTPSGDYAYFPSSVPAMTTVTGLENGGHRQLYRYDAVADQLDCVSCPLQGVPAGGASANAASMLTETQSFRHISDDGRIAAFVTSNALVAHDSNGAEDIYRWREGDGPALLTDGRTVNSSFLGLEEVSADGSSILFTSPAKLTPEVLSDRAPRQLYVARVGGGFPPPTTPPSCKGEGCRVGSPPPPTMAAPGTESFVAPPSRGRQSCPRGKVPKGKRCVKPNCPKGKVHKGKRCVKKERGGKRPAQGKGKGGRK